MSDQEPQGVVPGPQPTPVAFGVQGMRVGPQPLVRLEAHSATGIFVAFIDAGAAATLAMAIIDEAKKARAIPDLMIARDVPRMNGHP